MDYGAFLRRIPKAELHVHFTGSVQAGTLIDLARRHDVKLPSGDPETLYDRSGYKSILPMLKLVSQVLREPDDFRRATYETMREAAANGVRYREMFWNPTDHLAAAGVSYVVALEGLCAGLAEAETDFGIVGRLIPSIDRESAPELGLEMVEQVVAHPRPEVLGIGMDYLETGHPPEKFWRAYALAGRSGLWRTAHAGEFGEHHRNIGTALDLLQCDRIDHGYTIVDSPALQQRCRDEGIVFTVVPTNTYYARTLGEEVGRRHPLRRMVELGLRLSPSSDDPPLHHTDPGKAFIDMVDMFGCSLEDCRQFQFAGIEGAWTDSLTKRRWSHDWALEFDELLAQVDERPPV